MATIIDGKKIRDTILERLTAEVSALPFQPVFSDVLVGDNPVSAQYVRMKGKTAERIGISFRHANYPETITTDELVAELGMLGREPNMCGLIVQLPLPKTFDTKHVLDAIDPRIDVDSTGDINTRRFYNGEESFGFPTAMAVMTILDSLDLPLTEKKFLVVGQGALVGKPVAYLLKKRGYHVDIAEKETKNTNELIANADVIITATGVAKLIRGDMIKQGSVIIDAGTSESKGGIVGDVDFESVESIAGFVSPVPGGVGPVTVAMLLSNVVAVARATNK